MLLDNITCKLSISQAIRFLIDGKAHLTMNDQEEYVEEYPPNETLEQEQEQESTPVAAAAKTENVEEATPFKKMKLKQRINHLSNEFEKEEKCKSMTSDIKDLGTEYWNMWNDYCVRGQKNLGKLADSFGVSMATVRNRFDRLTTELSKYA